MKLKQILSGAAAAALLLWAGVANAALYNFTVSGDYSASWRLDSAPTPDKVSAGEGFVLWDVSGNFPGAVFGFVDLIFFHGGGGGGLQIEDFSGDKVLLSSDGAQLYTGAESHPVFKLGTFALSEFQGGRNYTLTIAAAVPEPATCGMLLGGLALVGAAARRRRA